MAFYPDTALLRPPYCQTPALCLAPHRALHLAPQCVDEVWHARINQPQRKTVLDTPRIQEWFRFRKHQRRKIYHVPTELAVSCPGLLVA